MSAHDRHKGSTGDRVKKRFYVLWQVRAGVDDRNLIVADEIGLRPVISECGRIVRQDAGYPRLERLQLGVRRVHGRPLPRTRLGLQNRA
jgi:hypothetical protein